MSIAWSRTQANCDTYASEPTMFTLPFVTDISDSSADTSDDLPEPVLPITATNSPRFIAKLIPLSAGVPSQENHPSVTVIGMSTGPLSGEVYKRSATSSSAHKKLCTRFTLTQHSIASVNVRGSIISGKNSSWNKDSDTNAFCAVRLP